MGMMLFFGLLSLMSSLYVNGDRRLFVDRLVVVNS